MLYSCNAGDKVSVHRSRPGLSYRTSFDSRLQAPLANKAPGAADGHGDQIAPQVTDQPVIKYPQESSPDCIAHNVDSDLCSHRKVQPSRAGRDLDQVSALFEIVASGTIP